VNDGTDRRRLPAPPPAVRGRRTGVSASSDVAAARALTDQAASLLHQSKAFQQLPHATRDRLIRDLGTIQARLTPTAASLGTPLDFHRGGQGPAEAPAPAQATAPNGSGAHGGGSAEPDPTAHHAAATETLARRAGALSDEIDFPAFVASLLHGTFDAIVDASIRQMETFADLVASIAKTTEDFTRDNVTVNQVRDWLVQQYPKDLALDLSSTPRVVPTAQAGEDAGDGEPSSPAWLADFGLEGEELTPDLIEDELVPRAREHVGQNRLQTLATMVLLGMNRVVVRDGTISARLRIRAVAADHAKVDYAVSDDPTRSADWGTRGSATYALPTTKVSTVGVNVQSDTDLRAELFGEVKINFASETVPLDRFVDDARRTLLERHARPGARAGTHAAGAAGGPVVEAAPPAAAPPPIAPAEPAGRGAVAPAVRAAPPAASEVSGR
jgi:hypothetical protein